MMIYNDDYNTDYHFYNNDLMMIDDYNNDYDDSNNDYDSSNLTITMIFYDNIDDIDYY